MSDKKLRISLDIDDKAFTSAVKRMQQELNAIQNGPALIAQQRKVSDYMRSQGLGGLTGVGPREQEQAQRRANQESDKLFQTTVTRLNTIKRLQADINKELMSGLATEKRRADLQERLTVLGRKEKEYTGMATAGMARGGTGSMVGGGAPGGTPDTFSMVKSVLGALGIGVGAAALVNLGKQVYTSYVSAPSQINLATGSAVQSAVGYQNQGILSGDIASQTLLQGQMGKGRGLAEKNFDAQISHKVSSFFAGYADSIAQNLNTEFGMHLDTDRSRNAFQANRASQISKDTVEQAQSSIAQQNSLVLANSYFGQTFNRNLGVERSLGLGTDQFKRMQMQMNNSGFMTDQGLGMLGQIQGAGGSAAGTNAGSLANLGLGAQRGLNLTNAGSVLGKLSGLSGSNNIGQTDETFKRVLEESIRKGFDKSENTEILRKFTESTAEIIYQGEASKGEDVERAARGLSQLLTTNNPTMKQFEGASGAYQRYQGLTSETSGRGGALGFAAFAGNKSFSKISPLQIGNLMALPENRITATNSDVVAAAVQQGISPQEMVTQILKAKEQQGLSSVGLSKGGLSSLKKYLGGKGISSIAGNYGEISKMQSASPEAFKAYQELQTRADLGGKSASDQEKIAMMQQFISGPAGYGPLGGTGRATAAIGTGTGGKKEEEYVAAQAAQEKQMVLNLKALEDNLYPTAKGIESLTQAIINLGSAAHMLTDEERARGVYGATPLGPVNTRAMGKTPSNGSKTRAGQ